MDLKKGMHPKDWDRMSKKHIPEYAETADHTAQPNVGSHENYINWLNTTTKDKGMKLPVSGISAKAVHDIDGSTYMAKPYHKKLESATRNYVKTPTTGWSTIATKALYNAGGIGHLCEDVSLHEHNGVPITVHKFAPNHIPVASLGELDKKYTDPLHAQQIGIMDFLTNNCDRHSNNLMVNGETDDNGNHPMLAIDHERSFQYHKTRGGAMGHWAREAPDYKYSVYQDRPYDYMRGNAISFLGSIHNHDHKHNYYDFLEWWQKNGNNIKNELGKHLSAIKDPEVREHISNNFHDRWDLVDKWANNTHEDEERNANDRSIFDKGYKGISNSHMPQGRARVDSILERTKDSKPYDAAVELLKHSSKIKGTRAQKAINEAIVELSSRMPDEDMVRFISNHRHHPNAELMLQHLGDGAEKGTLDNGRAKKVHDLLMKENIYPFLAWRLKKHLGEK